jgi:hypothetical protein
MPPKAVVESFEADELADVVDPQHVAGAEWRTTIELARTIAARCR